MKNINKKRKFNKKYIAFGIIGVFAMVLVSAALLTYYGQIKSTTTVVQGLTVDGEDWNVPVIETHSTTSIENPVFASAHYIDNEANNGVEVTLSKSCSGPSSCTEILNNLEYYETNMYDGTIILSKKDSNWNEITSDSDISVKVKWVSGDVVIDTITGLPIGYTLVYYADEEFDTDGNRLATPGQAYPLVDNGVIPISQNDGNLRDEADYCAFDSYDHCRGIKLWAIRDEDLLGNTITWNANWQSDYYFETDMLGWNHITGELPNPLEVPGNSIVPFVIVSEYPRGVYPGLYTVTTQVA